MSRVLIPAVAAQEGAIMANWRYIALHTGVAAAFIFVLQRYALNASLESSLLWALVFGGCAAGLAFRQSNR
jgi:Na+-transporting NADH:ubiquinone oxidoreductase subunit NqrB